MSTTREFYYDFKLTGDVISLANGNDMGADLIAATLSSSVTDPNYFLILDGWQVRLCCQYQVSQSLLQEAFFTILQNYKAKFPELDNSTILSETNLSKELKGTAKNMAEIRNIIRSKKNIKASEETIENLDSKLPGKKVTSVTITRDVRDFNSLTFSLWQDEKIWRIHCANGPSLDTQRRMFTAAIIVIEREADVCFPCKVTVFNKKELRLISADRDKHLTEKQFKEAFEQIVNAMPQSTKIKKIYKNRRLETENAECFEVNQDAEQSSTTIEAVSKNPSHQLYFFSPASLNDDFVNGGKQNIANFSQFFFPEKINDPNAKHENTEDNRDASVEDAFQEMVAHVQNKNR